MREQRAFFYVNNKDTLFLRHSCTYFQMGNVLNLALRHVKCFSVRVVRQESDTAATPPQYPYGFCNVYFCK